MSERFKHFEYEITGDDSTIDGRDNITPEIRKMLNETFEKLQRKKNSVLRELNDLIKKYPGIPQFKNQLFIAYAQSGNMKMANQINELILEEHPDYLFAKLNLAGSYLAKEEFDKVPELLGEQMEIKSLYPARNVFHLNEILSFNKIAIHYFLAIENIDAAETRLNILLDLPRDLTTDVDELAMLVRRAKYVKNFEEVQSEVNSRNKDVINKTVIAPSSERPIYNHLSIEQLYDYDINIDHAILRNLLSLPKQTLLEDLHTMVYDSIARFEYVVDEEEGDSTFPLHALFLMGEIGDESSLPVLLDVLRQDEEYLLFYYGDHLTESLWEIVAKLALHKTGVLKEFILEGNYYEFARTAVTTAMEQIALNFPERKDEVIQWYNDILLFFLANKDNDSLIDTGLISSMVCDLITLKAISSESLIEKLYQEELVLRNFAGTLQEVKKDLKSTVESNSKEEILSIFERYDHIATTWAAYGDDDELDEEDWDDEDMDDEDWDDEDKIFLDVTPPIVRTEPKIGRNDPCPCGSGKKYKKCHG